MGIALDMLLPVLLLGLIGYARHNKTFSDGQKNGISVVFFGILILFYVSRIWP